ncbi:MAG: hypothetical protein ACP5M0_16035 [Desulfomonilaceae bacterium]
MCRSLAFVISCVVIFSVLGCSGGQEQSATKGPVASPLAKDWTSSSDVVFQVTKDNFENNLKPLHQASLQRSNDKLIIESTGNDPYLQTGALDLKQPGRYVLKVRLSTPAKTKTQFFFGRPNTPYNEADSITVDAAEGWNDIFVELPQPETIVQVRFDPGTIPGAYELQEFSLKRISK